MRACVCACVHAGVRACAHLRACVHLHVCVRACVYVLSVCFVCVFVRDRVSVCACVGA